MRQPDCLRKLAIAGTLSFPLVALLLLLWAHRDGLQQPALAPPAPRADGPVAAKAPAPDPEGPAAAPLPESSGAAALTGRVTLDGQPAAGAEIRWVETAALAAVTAADAGRFRPVTIEELRSRWDAVRRQAASTRSGADGGFHVAGVRPGEVQVLVDHAEALDSRVLTCQLRAGEEARLDCDLARGLRIRGRVVTPGGGPAPGVRVRAVPSRLAAQGPLARATSFLCALDRGAVPRAASAETDAHGELVLHGLGDELHDLEAFAADGRRGGLERVPAGSESVVISLEAGGAILGRVRPANAGAQVAAVALSAAALALDAQDGAMLRQALGPVDAVTGPFRVPAAADGTFRIGGLPGGTYRVCATAGGFRPLVGPAVEVPWNREVKIPPLELAADRPLEGTVLSRGGEALAGVAILAFASGLPGQIEPLAEATTDARGRYAIAGLLGGLYDVEAWSPGWAPDRREHVKAGTRGIDFFLDRGLEIRGRAIDAHSREALPDVEITAFPRQRAVTDAAGAFALAGLPLQVDRRSSPVPDRLVITASLPGHRTSRLPVSWPPRSGGAEVTIELEPAMAIVGQVQTQDGHPAAGASVRLSFLGVPDRLVHGGPAVSCIAGSDGSFRLELGGDLELFGAGPRALLLARDPATGAAGAAEILADAVAELDGAELRADIVLGAGVAIQGTVKDPDGAPSRHAAIRLLHPPASGDAAALAHAFGLAEELAAARTDAAGRFAIRAVPAGEYLLEVLGRGAATLRQTVQVPAEGTLDVDLQLSRGRTLKGQVREAGGEPVPGAHILAWADFPTPVAVPRLRALAEEASGAGSALADDQGSYQISSLPDEALFVVARSPDHETLHVQVPPGTERQDLVLRPVVGVVGTIADAATGEPIPGCWVDLTFVGGGLEEQAASAWNASGGTRLWVSSPDAAFAFLRVPVGGPYELRVTAPEHRPAVHRLEARPDLEPLTVRLQAGLIIRGSLVNQATGEPIAAAVVRAVLERDARRAQSGADGSFELRGLSAGKGSLRIERDGFVTHSRPLTLGEDVALGEVQLEPAGRLELVIEGLPPGETEVQARGGDPSRSYTARPVGDGIFDLGGIPGGTFTLVVVAEGHLPLTIGTVEVRAGCFFRRHVTYAGQRRVGHEATH